MSIRLNTTGFEELLREVQKAQGDVDRVATDCMKQSADIMEGQIKEEMNRSGINSRLVSRMPHNAVTTEFGKITAYVGYIKGKFDPKNLSDGYKIAFLNYGTPHRTKHGKIQPTGFLARAKSKAKPKIKRMERESYDRIIKGLK